MKNKKKYIILTMSFLITVTVMLIGFTYAYYRTRVIGNQSEEPSVKVQSKKLEIVYSDDKATITADEIDFGWSANKEFSVENTGDETINYNIIFDNMENDFKLGGWFYQLEQVLTDGNNPISFENIARDSEYQIIGYDISINPGEIQNYVIKFEYIDTEMDQSEDMGKSMSLRVNIEENLDETTTPERVTIRYDAMYPDATNVPESETIEYGSDYILSSTIPEKGELYTFAGWSMSRSCDESSSAKMSAGSVLQNVENDLTLYACWNIQTG